MKRAQAIEFEDFEWFPSTLRNFMTDFYHSQMAAFNLYKPSVDKVADVMKKTGLHNTIDLCSGGTGPNSLLQQQLASEHGMDVNITLTDKYPNLPAFQKAQQESDGKIGFESNSVDATNVPENLIGVRTLFSSFHHFPPHLAKGILQDAIDKNAPIAIFELANRSLMSHIHSSLGAMLGLGFSTPFIKPFNILRLVFTYILPILPLLVIWDGIASNLRTYAPEEMNELIDQLDNKASYEWQTGFAKGAIPGSKVSYLIGIPK